MKPERHDRLPIRVYMMRAVYLTYAALALVALLVIGIAVALFA